MTKRCSFVFGGQQYDETVQFCVWRAAVGSFFDSGKEVIAGRAAPERCSAAWLLLWDRGQPPKP